MVKEARHAGEAQIRSRRTLSTSRFAVPISTLCPSKSHRAAPRRGREKEELQTEGSERRSEIYVF